MTASIDPALGEFTNEQAGCYTAGYLEGFAAGVARTDLDYQMHLGVARAALDLPMHEEIVRARIVTNEPCSIGRRNRERTGKVHCGCSRCIRFTAAWRNQREYGSPDFPGGTVAPW